MAFSFVEKKKFDMALSPDILNKQWDSANEAMAWLSNRIRWSRERTLKWMIYLDIDLEFK